jgi:hypothetical protein
MAGSNLSPTNEELDRRADLLGCALSQVKRFDFSDQSFLLRYAHALVGQMGRPADHSQLAGLSARQVAYLFVLARKARAFAEEETQHQNVERIPERQAG